MSYFHILSPYSGDPVKVRTEDIGRAVKDQEGRFFYVLKSAAGEGYYGSITRKGGEREEEQYRKLAAKTEHGYEKGREESRRQVTTHQRAESGTGRMVRKLVNLVVTLAVLAAVAYGAYWALTAGPFKDVPWNPLKH